MVNRAAVSSPGARSFERGAPPRSISHPSGPHRPRAGAWLLSEAAAGRTHRLSLNKFWSAGPRMVGAHVRESLPRIFVAGPQQHWDGVYVMTHNKFRTHFRSPPLLSCTSLSSCYPGGPSKRPAAEQMQMKVKHGLPRATSVIDNGAVAVGQLAVYSEFCRRSVANVPASRRPRPQLP